MSDISASTALFTHTYFEHRDNRPLNESTGLAPQRHPEVDVERMSRTG